MEKERFSLLLLEPGEFYFEDYSVYFISNYGHLLEAEESKLIGRLKMCSKSLVFDPKNAAKPIIKLPLKECVEINKWTSGLKVGKGEVLFVKCNQYVEMLAGNVLAPYSFKNNNCNFLFSFNYAQVDDCLPHICQLHRASTLPVAEQNQMVAAIAYARQCRLKFDPMWLEDLEEKIVLETFGSKITPLVVNPGRIVLSTLNMYFQPFNNIEPQSYIKIRLSNIKTIIQRRFLLQHVGLELYCKEDSPTSHIYLSLNTQGARDTLYNSLLDQPKLKLDFADQEIMTLQWQNGTISNYDYLLYINSLADRTFNDLTQYPVFPWVIADYASEQLDLSNPKSFRDLTKPVGALNPERLERLKERYNEMSLPKFLYGSHYSTPGFVLFYLVRKYPHYMLCLQNGRFDHPDRMFNSIPDIWRNVLTNMSDFKELVPEFYDVSQEGSFLENKYGINFGYRHDGIRVGDVALPKWANSPKDFVIKLREALETNYVSSKLHHWINLIFGYKQSGEEAEKSNNKFYYLCYEGAVDLDSIKDWNQRHALEVQIMEFGQIPKQVFFKPHPSRTCSILALKNSMANLKIGDCISYWDSNIMELKPSLCSQSHKDSVTDVAISKDLTTVVSVGKDTFLKMHNIANFKQERSVTLSKMPLSSIILLEDNTTAIIGSWDSSIIVYDIECGRIVNTFSGHEDAVCCIAWCKKRKHLISGSWDCSVRVWKANLPWQPIKPTSALLAQLHHDTKIPCLTISQDEDLMATGTECGNIFIWSMDTYKVTLKLTGHSNKISAIRFSQGTERIISCSSDHTFRIFDLSTGTQVYVKTLNQQLNCICWDGRHVLIGGSDGTLSFWDLVKNVLIKCLQAHTEGIVAIATSNDGKLVVTGGEDNRIVIWQTSNI